MKRHRKIWGFLLIVVIIIQFIQPKKNISGDLGENDISKAYAIPDTIHQTLTQKCYDCHSNNTRYPWYFNVQPLGWWLAAHVYKGKLHLNFSEFKTYPGDKAQDKLQEIIETVKGGAMPLKGYVYFHPHAEITKEDEKALNDWVSTLFADNH